MTVRVLRDTAASLAVQAGANVKTIQRMLGHTSAAMTLDVYSDLFDDDLDAVAAALDAASRAVRSASLQEREMDCGLRASIVAAGGAAAACRPASRAR